LSTGEQFVWGIGGAAVALVTVVAIIIVGTVAKKRSIAKERLLTSFPHLCLSAEHLPSNLEDIAFVERHLNEQNKNIDFSESYKDEDLNNINLRDYVGDQIRSLPINTIKEYYPLDKDGRLIDVLLVPESREALNEEVNRIYEHGAAKAAAREHTCNSVEEMIQLIKEKRRDSPPFYCDGRLSIFHISTRFLWYLFKRLLFIGHAVTVGLVPDVSREDKDNIFKEWK
jgi:hypothetical protein